MAQETAGFSFIRSLFPQGNPAATASISLHVILLMFLIFGMPSLWEKEKPILPPSISVDVLPPIAKQTNLKPKEEMVKADEPKKEEKKPEPPKPVSKPEPKSNPKPVEKPAEKPKPVKKEVAKDKPKEKPKDKPKEEKKPVKDDFNDLLRDLEKKKAQQKDQKKQILDYDPTQPITISEENALRAIIDKQLSTNWEAPIGARNPMMVVKVKFSVKQDGTIYNVSAEPNPEFERDPTYQALKDTAIRATYNASPIKELPAQFSKLYDHWKENTFEFDLGKLLGLR